MPDELAEKVDDTVYLLVCMPLQIYIQHICICILLGRFICVQIVLFRLNLQHEPTVTTKSFCLFVFQLGKC